MNIIARFNTDETRNKRIIDLIGSSVWLHFSMPVLTHPLPIGSIIKFPDITKDVPGVDNDEGDVWLKVIGHEYNVRYPDQIIMMMDIDSYYDADDEEIASSLVAKGKKYYY